jgi:hypothetical protein
MIGSGTVATALRQALQPTAVGGIIGHHGRFVGWRTDA